MGRRRGIVNTLVVCVCVCVCVCVVKESTINYKKTKLLAVLPDADANPPTTILLRAESAPNEVVPSFQYLGRFVSSDCTSNIDTSSRITKASQSFGSLSHILWHLIKEDQSDYQA